MDDLTHLITFTRVAQAGSFSVAARRLGINTTVASKHVAKLERRLGVTLLNRSARGVTLTDVGAAYLAHCMRIIEELELSRETLTHLRAEPQGLLRMSASSMFAGLHVASMIPEFLARYPNVRVELDCTERLVDLVHEAFDLVLRVARTPPAGVGFRKLAPVRWVVCASPAYVKAHGVPSDPSDAIAHECLCYLRRASGNIVHFRKGKREISISVSGRMYTNSMDILRLTALRGMGLALLPSYAVSEELKQGALVALYRDYELEEGYGIYALYSAQRFESPKVSAFIDFLVERIGSVPYWDLDTLP